MTRIVDLPIRVKFFALLTLLLLVLFVISALFTYHQEKSFIIRFAIDNGRSLAKELIETRDYISSVEKGEAEHNYDLVPQVVATQVAKRVTQNSEFYVRQVSLRYRNPGNRPDSYESAELRKFAKNPAAEAYALVKSGNGEIFRYMQPMIATPSCLKCHGTYAEAPDFVKKRWPPGHYSYNYHIGEVIGAVSVSIPLKALYAQVGANLELDLLVRGIVLLIVVIVMGLIISREIVRPVQMLSAGITRVTRTGNFQDKLPKTSKDEIGTMIGAFNELMDELSRRTQQSQESEERYRRFIEMAASAVVTFLRDGKIVIANRKAESLFGRTRQELLGESIYAFLENGAELQQLLTSGADVLEESTSQKVHAAGGRITEVEMVVSASKTDREPMFTAILRESRRP